MIKSLCHLPEKLIFDSNIDIVIYIHIFILICERKSTKAWPNPTNFLIIICLFKKKKQNYKYRKEKS